MKKIKLLLACIIIAGFFGQLQAYNYQGNWRWRSDDGNETTANWKASEKTAISISDYDNLRLRVEAYSSDSKNRVLTLALGYKKQTNSEEPEEDWKLVTNDSSSNAFVLSLSTNVADLDTTSNLLSINSDNFAKGAIYTSTYAPTLTLVANTSYEFEFCIKPTSKLEYFTTYKFRLLSVGTDGELSEFTENGTIYLVSPKGPPEVATDLVMIYNANSATMGGNVIKSNGEEVTEKGIVYNTIGNPTIADTKVIIESGSYIFSEVIEGLVLDTTYYVKAYATNSLGTSYGKQVSFTTIEPNSPEVVTSPVTIFDKSSAKLGGNVIQSNGQEVTQRGVVYNTTGNPTEEDSREEIGTGLGVFSVDILELEINTTYYVKAYAKNSLGTSFGDEISFTTAKWIPEVFTNEVTIYDQNSATLGGEVTNDYGAEVTQRGVVYNTDGYPTTSDTKVIMGSGLNDFSGNVTGLEPNTYYSVRAFAINSIGTSYGDEVNFETAPSTPKVVTTAVATYNGSSAVLGGEVISDNGDEVTERGVVYNTTGNPTTSDVKVTMGVDIGDFSESITGLTLGTTYYVKAYAINTLGTSYGEEVTFTTMEPTSPLVVTSAVTIYDENSATLGGNVLQSNGEEVTERGIVYNTTGNPSFESESASEQIGDGIGVFLQDISGLEPNTTYYVKAYAYNTEGYSYGDEVTFTTNVAPRIILKEGFDYVSTLQDNGWVEINKSTELGSEGYLQGDYLEYFDAYDGEGAAAYLAVSNQSGEGNTTISNWMITPQLTLQNGDRVSFWTRAEDRSYSPDRLQFYLNTLGTTNVGSDANSTGDFSALLQDINPSLAQFGYPETWTKYTMFISGLSQPTVCRFAFRYFVTNGGTAGDNSQYIGIDEFLVSSNHADPTTLINNISENSFSIYPNPALERIVLRTNSTFNGNYLVRFTNAQGQIVKSETMKINPNSEYRLLHGLSSGLYIMSIVDVHSGVISSQRLIIK